MRVTIERDGKTANVEVSDDLAHATIGGKTFPVKVVARTDLRVELEVAGEKVVVENWPDHFPEPPGPVDVNGERWGIKVGRGPGAAPPTRRAAPSAPPPPPGPSEAPPAGNGVAVVPPMPGKVIEVRVREFDRVHKGDVLLVLEAMKMRNEVTSPTNGTVKDLRVEAGTNVRAKEPMLYVVPGE